MANVLDCRLKVKLVPLQSRYYVPFWINIIGKGMNLLFSSGFVTSLLFFYKNNFAIK